MKNKLQNSLAGLSTFLDSAYLFCNSNKNFFMISSTILSGVIGILLFLWGTSTYGIGIRSDSIAYLWSAKNLANGIGLGTLDAFGKLQPLNHYPPLYPLLLASFEIFRIDPMVGARWLGAAFIGLLVLLFTLILYRLTERSFWFPIIGVLTLLFMPALWETSLYAMTEPLYLTCSLTGMIFLDNYSTTTRRRWLFLAAILFSLSFLTRYIGLTVIIVGMLFLLIKTKGDFQRKLGDLLILGGIGFAPMAIWLLLNHLQAVTGTDRSLQYIAITAQEWQFTFNSLRTWIEPIRAVVKVNLLYLGILVIALGIAFLNFRHKENHSKQTLTHLPMLLALYTGLYLLLTIGSRLFADPTIPLYEARILYPFLTAVFFLVLYALHLLLDYLCRRSRLLSIIVTGFLVIASWSFIRSYSSATFPYVRPVLHSHTDGLGLQFRPYLMEPFQNAVAQLPDQTLIFSDNVEPLYFFTTKPSSYIGDLTPADIKTLQVQVAKGPVAVVFMDTLPEKQQTFIDQLSQFHLVFTDDNGRAVYLGTMNP